MTNSTDKAVQEFYKENGKCCAGCDWWQYYNSITGDCTKSAPVSGSERHSMLDVEGLSLPMNAGHIITTRDHVCGDFVDSDLPTETPFDKWAEGFHD